MKEENNKKKKVLFVCNTGGHLSEMMALSSLFPEYNSMLLTEKAVKSMKISIGIPVEYLTVSSRNTKNPFLSTYCYIISFIQSLFYYIYFRPDVIVTTGVNLAVSICYIGKLFSSKIVLIETLAKVYGKTMTGKILEPIADLIIVQWPEMLKIYKKSVYWGITFQGE